MKSRSLTSFGRRTLTPLATALLAGAMLMPGSASASLIFDETIELTGTGFGSVHTILGLQATGQDDTESGFVEWTGTATMAGGDDVLPGEVHTNTVLVSDLGLTDAADLRLVFDANEPHGGDQISILLESLVLTLFSAGGDILAEFGLAQDDILFEQPPGFGTGKSGGAFVLDAAQAAELNNVLTADARFGLAATLSMAQDGPEQFFLTRALGPDEIPEPASLALLGSGLLGLGLLRRRAKAWA